MKAKTKTLIEMRNDAADIFYDGIKAVDPSAAIGKYCKLKNNQFIAGSRTYDLSRFKRVFVIGAGKATAPMASAIEGLLGNIVSGGAINVKYGYREQLRRIKLIEAGHPIPDKNGQIGANYIFNIAHSATEDDLVICLISGGGSALLPLPAPGLSLQDKQDAIRQFLSCGATIHEINTIRKHVSLIKGGQLARTAYPATLVSLLLSDVVGDDVDVIASGPTVPDSSTFEDCMNIIEKYDIQDKLPKTIISRIKSGISGQIPETPKSGDPIFQKTHNFITGSNIDAVIAGKQKAESLGYNALILSSLIEGDTTQVAQVHSAIAKEILKTGNPVPPPACILSGGETTVKLVGKGLGGRNQEFALASAIEIEGYENIVILSAGTDGTDGPTDAAGAISDTHTLKKATAVGVNAVHSLMDNDSYHFFKAIGDLFITGPTNTNVMDLRLLLVN